MRPEIEFKVIDDSWKNLRRQLILHRTEEPNFEARLATQLLERWGMITADFDGEDTSGRQKMRKMNVEETVRQAVDTAEMAVQAFRDKGWMIQGPSIDEIYGDADV